jgi:hypothetical protein
MGFKLGELYHFSWARNERKDVDNIEIVFCPEQNGSEPIFRIVAMSRDVGRVLDFVGSPNFEAVREWHQINLSELPLYISWPVRFSIFYKLLKG